MSEWQCLAQLYPITDFDPGGRGPLVFVVGDQFGMALPWPQGSGGTGFGQSGDGIAWSSDAIYEPVQMDKLIADVAVSPTGVVAVGAENAGDGTPGVPAVWTSDDGGAWTAVRPSGVAGRDGLRRVAAHGSTVVAVGGLSLYSAAWGKPLASVTLGADARIDDMTSTGAGFVAVGSDGRGAAVWRSGDGRRWDYVSLPGTTASSVAAVGLVLLVDGTTDGDTAARWRSADGGVTWAEAAQPAGPEGGRSTFGLAAGFLETGPPSGEGLAVWTSVDGITWAEHPIPASPLGDLDVSEGWSAADDASTIVLAARTPSGMTSGGVAICAAPRSSVLATRP